MGAEVYYKWLKDLPEGVEMVPLELPARGRRLGEPVPYAHSMPDLASKLVDGVGREPWSRCPFAIFGHSFGAWVAYEVCLELVRRGWPIPLKLYVSGTRPPHLAGAAFDPDEETPELSTLQGAAFWEAFERRYGRNPVLQERAARTMVGPLLRADFALLEQYQQAWATTLPAGIQLCALCALGDKRCRPGQLTAWRRLAGRECAFRERWFEGTVVPGHWANEHRFFLERPEALLRFLGEDLPIVGQAAENPTLHSGIEGPLPGSEEELSQDFGQGDFLDALSAIAVSFVRDVSRELVGFLQRNMLGCSVATPVCVGAGGGEVSSSVAKAKLAGGDAPDQKISNHSDSTRLPCSRRSRKATLSLLRDAIVEGPKGPISACDRSWGVQS